MRAVVGYTDEEAERDRQDWRDRLESCELTTRPAGGYRLHDWLGRLEPRNIFADAVLPLRLWGVPGLFARVVPSEHIVRALGRDGLVYLLVVCPCGAESVLERAAFTECRGGCGRWFLQIGDAVRVHRFMDVPQ